MQPSRLVKEIEISHLSQHADGVGFDEDRKVYFVAGALPQERVEVEVSSHRARYADAELKTIVVKSDSRRDPPCKYFGKCGGCDLQHLSYPAQVDEKVSLLKHVLVRNGLGFETMLPPVHSNKEFGYRHRIQLKVSEGRLGFYAKHSHDFIEIESCLLATEAISIELAKLRSQQKLRQQSIEIEQTQQGDIIVREGDANRSFMQANPFVNIALQQTVANFSAGAKCVLELYCGDGNLTQDLRAQWERYLGIDSNQIAIDNLRESFVSSGAQFSEALCSEVSPEVLEALDVSFDTVIIDPPRFGSIESAKFLMREHTKKVILVSCSLDGFIRNAKSINASGFQLKQIQLLDMFPNTRHFEIASCFVRE